VTPTSYSSRERRSLKTPERERVFERTTQKREKVFFALFWSHKRPKISERRAIFFLPQMKNAFPHYTILFLKIFLANYIYNVCTSRETTPMSEEEER